MHYAPWHKLSEPRQQVLSMCSNRGVAGVLAFKRMLAAASGLRRGGWGLASKWGCHVGGRANELAPMMRQPRSPCAI